MADRVSDRPLEIVMGDPKDARHGWASSVEGEECDAGRKPASSPSAQPHAQPTGDRCPPTAFVRPPWKTPLEADIASKRPLQKPFSRRLHITMYLRDTEHALRDAQGKPYKVTVSAPKGFLSDCALKEFLRTAEYLNTLQDEPIRKFHVRFESEYSALAHQVSIAGRYQCERLPRDVRVLGDLVHEMGHGIFYKKKFNQNKDWGHIHDLGLGWQNYEIIDDSNYIPGADDALGHPHSSPSESFASSVATYYLYADAFRNYIQHRATPARMRAFGKLVWCVMREQVFGGRVFTSDGRDPFKAESAQGLLTAMRPHRGRALLAALAQEETFTILTVERFDPETKDVAPALVRILRDRKQEPQKRHAAAMALREIGPGIQGVLRDLIPALGDPEADIAMRVAEALAACGPAARSAASALLDAFKRDRLKWASSYVMALKKIGADLSVVVGLLIQGLDRKNEETTIRKAIRGLAEAGPVAASAVVPLRALLKDDRFALEAIFALEKIGPAAKDAEADLVKLLQDEKHRLSAALVLLRLGLAQRPAALVVAKEWGNPRNALVFAWDEGVQRLVREQVVPLLAADLADKEPKVRSHAASLLGSLGAAAQPARSALERARKDPDEVVRYQAGQALQKIKRDVAATQPFKSNPFF
jgi:HEAT repeat protein